MTALLVVGAVVVVLLALVATLHGLGIVQVSVNVGKPCSFCGRLSDTAHAIDCPIQDRPRPGSSP